MVEKVYGGGKMAVGGRRNVMTNVYPCICFFLLLLLQPSLASITDMYVCLESHLGIKLHEDSHEILIHPNGGAVNLSISSILCDFSFKTSYTQEELEQYQDIVQVNGKRWTKLAFGIYPSGLYIYPKIEELSLFYTLDVISRMNSTRIKHTDGNCLLRKDLKLNVSTNSDVGIVCKEPPKMPSYKPTYNRSSSYSYRSHVIWIPVGGIIVLCAACCRFCRLKCCPCLDKPRSQQVVLVRPPPSLEVPIRHGPNNLTMTMPPPPPPYSRNPTASPPPNNENTTELPPPYSCDTEPPPPNLWVPPSAKKPPTDSDMLTTNNSSTPASTNDVPMLSSNPSSSPPSPPEPVPSSAQPPSPANNADHHNPQLSKFKNQFGFKRLQEE